MACNYLCYSEHYNYYGCWISTEEPCDGFMYISVPYYKKEPAEILTPSEHDWDAEGDLVVAQTIQIIDNVPEQRPSSYG